MDLRAIAANFGNTIRDWQEVTYLGVVSEEDAVVRDVQYSWNQSVKSEN